MKFLTYLVLSLPFVGAYAMFAVGIVVMYRASRVLNLAHGAMAMVPAYVVFQLSGRWHYPMYVSVLVGIIAGAILGLIIERVFVRGLRHLSLTAQTVGTVAVLSLLMEVAAKIWGTGGQTAPGVFPDGRIKVGAGFLQYGSIGLFVVAVGVAFGMLALFKYTNLGLAMRGAAENRRAAALMGINPDRTTAIAWGIGGALAALSGILLAAITILHPYKMPLQVLPAFVAALLGGLESLTGAISGAAAVGVLLGIVPAFASTPGVSVVLGQTGAPQFVLTVAALAAMFFRGQRFSAASRDDGGFTTKAKMRSARRLRIPAFVKLLLVVGLVAWVWMPNVPFSILANANQALFFAIVGVSLVVLTGWVGQISLGHAAFVGIGAFITGILARRLNIDFPFNLPIAALISAGAAAILGAVALRVRGLYLAVATLVFSWMADEFLFKSSWFVGSGGSSTIENVHFGVRGGFPNFDFSDRKILYLFALAVAALAILAAANLRSSKTGRAFFATRGSEMAAASLGVNVMRYKLLAFAFSGFLAGAAGNLFLIDQRTITPDLFGFVKSLFYLSIAVIGGLSSLGGVVAAAALFAALNEVFLRVSFLGGYLQLVSSGLLVFALLLQAYSGRLSAALAPLAKRTAPLRRPVARAGAALNAVAKPLAGASAKLRASASSLATKPLRLVVRRTRPTMALASADAVVGSDALVGNGNGSRTARPGGATASAPRTAEGRIDAEAVLSGVDITVRFGGLTAVADASIEVRRGEIVGLIGPNGAGKTTLFNALSGLNQPTAGRVRLFGADVSEKPVHERAKLGLARTFQVIQLFGDLTVRENLMVATHVHNETGFLRHMLATDAAVRAEADAARRVDEIVRMLDLEDIADRSVAGLPFGLLRLVEIGRAVVTEAPIILLDEAASGLDNTETDRLVAFLRSLRDRLGISMLLIEHDVQMVTGISDYMYVLNQGRIISEGPPASVQRDPAVIAAYLGESVAEPAAV